MKEDAKDTNVLSKIKKTPQINEMSKNYFRLYYF